MSPAPQAWVTLGRISGLYGVRGWVRVFSLTEPRTGILDYPTWWLKHGEGPRTPHGLVEGRRHGAGVVAAVAGVTDRNAAQALIGADIEVPRESLPEPDEGEYYWVDLIGLAVENRAGVRLGRITGFIPTGAHDVMIVAGEAGGERLIPYVPGHFVDEVSLADGRMVVDWHVED